MAEKIGELVTRKERKKEARPTKEQVKPKKIAPKKQKSSSDEDERIYDFPPEAEVSLNKQHFV